MIENIVEKVENTDHQHFPLFPQYLEHSSTSDMLKLGIVR